MTSPLRAVEPPRCRTTPAALSHQSSMREKVFEHLLLAELGLELMARGVEFEVLHGETDRDGFDVVMEAGQIARHMQLKVMIDGGARSAITVNTRLADKPSGCVIWLTFDPIERRFSTVRWFGARPGEPLPDAGTKVARHTRANSEGVKALRPSHRVIQASRFELLEDIPQLADRLFGILPADPYAFLLARLTETVPGPAWLDDMIAGNFAAIPTDFGWESCIPLAHLVDGYRLAGLLSDEGSDRFLDRQRYEHARSGVWPGDAITLWTTLFLEARAHRFADVGVTKDCQHLDQLCQQLRAALVMLEHARA